MIRFCHGFLIAVVALSVMDCCARTFHRKGEETSHFAVREIVGKVTRVSDGDTVWVCSWLGRQKIRLNRIDAPESDQPFGKEATSYLKSLIGCKEICVKYETIDRYGRILGSVFLGETDINLQMVRDGCAWHYSHFDKTPTYADAEREARAEKRGLWAADNPINPHQWRKSKREGRFVRTIMSESSNE